MKRYNDQINIEIADTGDGMDKDFIRDRLFKPFDTTKGNAGMGIGVYESREIIRELGGSIKVESKPNIGSKFTINLPISIAGDNQFQNKQEIPG